MLDTQLVDGASVMDLFALLDSPQRILIGNFRQGMCLAIMKRPILNLKSGTQKYIRKRTLFLKLLSNGFTLCCAMEIPGTLMNLS